MHARAPTLPPLDRSPMAPSAPEFGARAPLGRPAGPRAPWHGAARLRRTLLVGLVLAQTTCAAYFMAGALPYQGRGPLEAALLAVFTLLFAWLSAGFWTALLGAWVLLRGRDRYAISASGMPAAPLDPAARTAIVMPICNESVARVFAGLRATYRSLERTGELARFDFFVLSDSGDPDARVAETRAWLDACRELGAFGRLFYRWRRVRLKKKAGNIGDFCRRWGRAYRYMVVLDADSVMSGDCLVALVRLMEANPDAGIIQTAPRAAGRRTFYARMQQFAGRVYGPLFIAGMHFWELGEAHYWGHNAIIRVAPFMRHCALGRLRGRGPLAGEILSHDFVEAALMRRAGWGVWLAYDLPGSYEEIPPNLVDELARDRRWCLGNLINGRFLVARGMSPAQRAVFATGIMAYVSAPLWFLLLLLGTAMVALRALVPPAYFVEPRQLFPLWPQWHLEWAIGLLSATALLLFLPKVIGVALALAREPERYGGRLALCASALLETVLSALLAPIRMLFHTQFVLGALTGLGTPWRSPPREDAETGWHEALRRHGWQTLLGVLWAAGVHALDPQFLWWLVPVVGALLLSIPISVLTSRVALGCRLRAAGIFLIPEEAAPPPELEEVEAAANRPVRQPGFADAVLDPGVNRIMRGAQAPRRWAGQRARAMQRLLERAGEGAAPLGARERLALLADPLALERLHEHVHGSPAAREAWLRPAGAPYRPYARISWRWKTT
ncbi:MAG TPA: glucans biosynthesis glucosyltransferase MdoH [Burkholderiales bacterium]